MLYRNGVNRGVGIPSPIALARGEHMEQAEDADGQHHRAECAETEAVHPTGLVFSRKPAEFEVDLLQSAAVSVLRIDHIGHGFRLRTTSSDCNIDQTEKKVNARMGRC